MDTISDDIFDTFLHGHCHLLAIALHELTGQPLGACVDSDVETGETVLVHAFVYQDNICIDVRGETPIDEVIGYEFDTFSPRLIAISRSDLLQLGHGSQTLSNSDEDYVLAKQVARIVLQSLNKDIKSLSHNANI